MHNLLWGSQNVGRQLNMTRGTKPFQVLNGHVGADEIVCFCQRNSDTLILFCSFIIMTTICCSAGFLYRTRVEKKVQFIWIFCLRCDYVNTCFVLYSLTNIYRPTELSLLMWRQSCMEIAQKENHLLWETWAQTSSSLINNSEHLTTVCNVFAARFGGFTWYRDSFKLSGHGNSLNFSVCPELLFHTIGGLIQYSHQW